MPDADLAVHGRAPSTKAGKETRVLIVCESASAKFGGEAALPLHYFRALKQRGIPVWLLTHARTRNELATLFPGDRAIRYIEDSRLHRALYRIGSRLPHRLAYFTLGFISRLSTQLEQRQVARRLIAEERIDIVHQPVPVSPREPSMMFGLGVPVVIGPMNGGMDYPAGFGRGGGALEALLMRIGRAAAFVLNRVMPGKRQATMLLVANDRTRAALPWGLCQNVTEMVENGVDMAVWQHRSTQPAPGSPVRFVFLGRLVDWKAVDLLLHAFSQASRSAPMQLAIVGDGDERQALEALAATLGLGGTDPARCVEFTGWLPQQACAERLGNADCLVLPSLLECGGAVVLEAMALGKPVIATAWGGPADYLDASCGILVDPSGREPFIAGLRDAMVRIATSPEERLVMGANGRRKVEREYDWDVKVEKMLGFYASAARRELG